MSVQKLPLAIIGMACRFPGEITTPAGFWQFMMAGKEAVGELPEGRWDAYLANRETRKALQGTTKVGNFLSDIAGFDAEFFGISPREAVEMDPQQRLILEVTWEALEHAGLPPASLAGTDTGVFVGVGTDDYGRRLLEDLPGIEAWTGIGASLCAVANRISYTLDLRGPSIAIDTACSSSLAAIHLASESLRLRETPVAIVGGVMLMAGPGLTMVLDAANAISPDGRSKAFGADADGYGRGEGCGIVVLKRLEDARRDGDRVLAVVRGSGVYQDGKTNGIMAPSGPAQEHLLRRTWQRAGLEPASADYIEAHGTGTRLGDPLEAAATSAVFGVDRPADAACLIGSVKTNIGHLEAGSGIAGIIKTVLAMRHGVIPASLNASTPNPAIPWQTSGLRLVNSPTPWPDRIGQPRRAGVSGYGYGGTIAHVILDGPEPVQRTEPAEDHVAPGTEPANHVGTPLLYPLSGGSPAGVRAYADGLIEWLRAEGSHVALEDIGHTLALRRSHLPHRGAVVAADRDHLAAGLRAFANGPAEPPPDVPRAVWVYSGHGSQWIGMGRELLRDEPAFRAAVDELTPVFEEEMGLSPLQVLDSGDLHTTDRIQAMIFVVQIGLTAALRSYGLSPAAVIGHSVGEIAAAVAAGALTPADGAKLVCRRSLLLRRVAGHGAMVMVNMTFDEARQELRDRSDVVAAISPSPGSTVISGDREAVAAAARQWEDRGLRVRSVKSDVAFHSPHMTSLAPDLAAACHDLTPHEPTVQLYSTALADPRSNDLRDGDYWAANLRDPVRFTAAVRAAAHDGHRLFTEISPHPVVTHSIMDTLITDGLSDVWATYTLRRETAERPALLEAIGELYRHGADVAWDRLHPGGSLADLPVTAWQHRRYWREPVMRDAEPFADEESSQHTLLGARLTVWSGTPLHVWRTRLDTGSRPYPGDHPVLGTEIIPAAVLLNTFFAAAGTQNGTARPQALTDVALRVPVAVTVPREIQVVLQNSSLRLSSRALDDKNSSDDDSWLTHTTAHVSDTVAAAGISLAETRGRCGRIGDPGSPVARLASVGVAAMGFHWVVRELWHGDGEMVARVRTCAEGSDTSGPDDGASNSWAPLLDAALSVASTVFEGPQELRMPAHIDFVELSGAPPAEAWIAVRATAGSETADVAIFAADGHPLAVLQGLAYGRIDKVPSAQAHPRHLVHQPTWHPVTAGAADCPGADRRVSSAVFVDPDGRLGDAIVPSWTGAGVRCQVVREPSDLPTADVVIVVPPRRTAPDEAAWTLVAAARELAGTGRTRLWCVTEGVRECAQPHAVAESALWGLGRIIATEHPGLWGGVIDLDQAPSADTSQRLLALVRGGPLGEIIATRGGEDLVERLVRVDGQPERDALQCQPNGTYLITGGLGVLGLEVARWLADRGARRLILAGRTTLPARITWPQVSHPATLQKIAAVQELESLGVTVCLLALDIADPERVRRSLDPDVLGLPAIRGIVHAAGVLDSRLVTELDRESLRAVMAPKARGAMVLHELFPPGSLDFFVLFSSVGLMLGLPGQASYAAANSVLDGLARHRASTGHADTMSIGWTSWRGLGMSTSSLMIDMELAARGTADVSATEAFQSWDFAHRRALAYAAVLRILPAKPGMQRPPLLADLSADDSATPLAAPTEASEWDRLPAAELDEYMTAAVAQAVAVQIGVESADVKLRQPLAEVGLDSIMAMALRRGLELRFGLSLPTTLLWNYPTVAAIGQFISGVLTHDEDAPPDQADLPTNA